MGFRSACSILGFSFLHTTFVYAQSSTSVPGQPSHQGNIGGFEIIGSSLVSAQQVGTRLMLRCYRVFMFLACRFS